MSDDLVATVLDLANNDTQLSEDAKLLVLAALDGDAMLDDALAGTATPSPPTPAAGPSAGTPTAKSSPTGAYLSNITVEGFRGIGPRVTVPRKAGPGLLLIAGRNGSGKSTIAEALELALTGDSYRWANRTAVWSEQWRNLHQPEPSAIRVGIAEDGGGATVLGVDWAKGAELDDRQTWLQRAGQKRVPGADPLGWAAPMETFRPLLSYEEVGAILEGKPSELFDKLSSVLGLERLIDAKGRLDRRSKEIQVPITAHKAGTRNIKDLLAAADDPRATQALALMKARTPNLPAILGLATGSDTGATQELSRIARLTQLTDPSGQDTAAAATALRGAVDQLAEASGTASKLLDDQSRLLRSALDLHARHGDMPCPVCGVGSLDDPWAKRSSSLLEQQEASVAELRARQSARAAARRSVDNLVNSVPDMGTCPDPELTSWDAAVDAVTAWRAAPADDLALADHIDLHIDDLISALGSLRQQAAEVLTARQDLWAPLASQLAGWVTQAHEVSKIEPTVELLKEALKWLKTNEAGLRNQRLAPLADQARAIWALLRQESNVDLGAISLDGEATRRRVTMQAQVDGAPAGALSVMSQGELQALALALFLPRATSPESPFRFVVLDDPVQAMDPAKIDGFVHVLEKLSQDRQVIVLSHDDRLPAAVRRMRVKANIYEVSRGTGSKVSIRESLHPAQRYVEDAYALATDNDLPDEVKSRVIPLLCRMALETAAHEKYTARSYAQGIDRADVEATWKSTHKLRPRLSLGLFGDADKSIDGWLDGGGRRKTALYVANSKTHSAAASNHVEDVRAVRTAVSDLRSAP